MEHSDKNNDIKQHSAEPEEQLTEKQDNLDTVKSPETPVTSETPNVPETPESTESQETQDSSDSSDSPDSSDSISSVDAADEETIIEEKARLRRERRNRVWFVTKYVLVNICRAILSITFLFSAFTKANDPVGFVIKLRDYAGALGMTTIPDYLLYVPAILLTIVETILGIYLFVGVKRRRRVAALATLFMMIMTAVTVWIAIKNPVSDCGCFGDAVILSNNQTLVKNIILLAMAVFITANYKMMFRLIHRDWNWIITIPVVVGAVALFSYCTYMLPIVDFLPFAEGTDLRQTVKTGDALDMNYKVSIVYTNGTDTLMLSPEDDDPDSTVWKYVETRNELLDDHLESTSLKTMDIHFLSLCQISKRRRWKYPDISMTSMIIATASDTSSISSPTRQMLTPNMPGPGIQRRNIRFVRVTTACCGRWYATIPGSYLLTQEKLSRSGAV